jgi:hypothetical protein
MIIKELIQALSKEIEALKKGKGGKVIILYNGQFIRSTGGLNIYQFHLENFLSVLDDTPAEIEIKGRKLPCQIISNNKIKEAKNNLTNETTELNKIKEDLKSDSLPL